MRDLQIKLIVWNDPTKKDLDLLHVDAFRGIIYIQSLLT